MSKADQIRKLLHLPTVEIATRTKTHEGYVRAVRQRTSKSGNPIETESSRRWKERHPELVREYDRISKQRKYRRAA